MVRLVLVLSGALALAGGCEAGKTPTALGEDSDVGLGVGSPSFSRGQGVAPVVSIVAPQADEVLPAGSSITLTGLVSDDGPTDSLVATWSSDLSGTLGTYGPNAAGLVVAELGEGLEAGVHTLTFRVTDTDGASGEADVTILANAAPELPAVVIDPDLPGTDDDLEASLVDGPQDPDRASDGLELSWRWLVDGENAGISAPFVPAALTERGQLWQVRASVSDGHVDGPEGEASVTIGNSPPICGHVALLPSAGNAFTQFTCSCTEREDADGDAAAGDVCEFRVGGLAVGGPECTLAPGAVIAGQELTCVYTPSDGSDAGMAVQSEPLTIMNAPPTTPEAGIDPAFGGLGTSFTCHILDPGTDPDGDELDWSIAWMVGDFENPATTTATMTPSSLAADASGGPPEKGDLLRCRVRAFDGTSFSTPGDSPPVVLGNSPPVVESALVGPTGATELDVLGCEPIGGMDPDGDDVSWIFSWHVDGETVPGQTGASLTGAFFDEGDVVGCTATPTDGLLEGQPVTSKNTVTIDNAPPTLEGALLTPAGANQLGTFTCAAVGLQDPDPADLPFVDVVWEITAPGGDAESIPSGPGATLPAAGLQKGTQVRCVATPNDGEATGPSATSPPSVVLNTLPSLAGVQVTPADGSPCASFVCEPEGLTDPDEGDEILVAYRWTLDDAPAGAPKGALEGVELLPGDVLHCFAQPTDGALSAEGVPLYGLEVASLPVVVGNSPPVVAGALLEPVVPSPADPLTCLPQGLEDPDTCQGPPEAQFKWYIDGVLVDGQQEAVLPGGLAEQGSEVACQVIPFDGWDLGQPALSSAVVVGPQLPVVAIDAPFGPDGVVVCELVVQATYSKPLTYSFFWSLNGGPEQELGPLLPAADVEDCDVVSCWAFASSGDYEVPSNVVEVAFGFGEDCADGDPCTVDGCLEGGGCDHSPSAGSCDDGNACTEGEACAGGLCLGGLPLDCDDSNDCTLDQCTGTEGCVHEDIEGSCGPGGAGVCVDGGCCVPSCSGKDCGDDGCGETCGECTGGAACDDGSGQCFEPTEGMVVIPKGGFWMGCNDKDDGACKNDEYPFHGVSLGTYEIDQHEVTTGDYSACVASFDCIPPGTGPGCNHADPDKLDHPINCVSWYDAEFYCAWLDKRLCTEAEWEKAARGPDGRRYPWGFDVPECDKASSIGPGVDGDGPGCGTGTTSPVGSFPEGASPYGLDDMAGNVFEWVADWYDDTYYATSPKEDPPGPEGGSFRVRRGGAFDSTPEALRCSARRQSTPGYTEPAFGIRCCKDFP